MVAVAEGDPAVVMAMGMVVAPLASLRRQNVRDTMLRYESVLSHSVAFRFIVGKELPTLPPREQRSLLRELRREGAEHGDVLSLSSIDGPHIDAACSCGEKLVDWVVYALRAWPAAPFIGKTEDDTYVQLDSLMHDLIPLRSTPNVRPRQPRRAALASPQPS